MPIMRVTSRRTVVIVAGETDRRIGHGGQVRPLIGPGAINPIDDRLPATELFKHRHAAGLTAAVQSRLGPIARVSNAGKNKSLAPTLNRLLCRSIFCPKNAPFRKLSSKLNKDTSPIRYSAWHACFWSARSAIGSGFVRWTIIR